jgi:hypothetical protein
MRWCVALGIVLAALIAATVKVAARRPVTREARQIAETSEPDAPSELTPAPAPRAAPARRTARPAPTVVALPVLRGAIGFPTGEDCPISRVALYEPSAVPTSDSPKDDSDDDGEGDTDDGSLRLGGVDDACRFELPVPDGPTGMVLVAVGGGWHLEEPVSIPPLGDPDPICLNPPCRADPLGVE